MGRSPERYEGSPVVCEKRARRADLCSLLRFQHLPWQTRALQQILGQASDSPIDLLGCDRTQLRLEGLRERNEERTLSGLPQGDIQPSVYPLDPIINGY